MNNREIRFRVWDNIEKRWMKEEAEFLNVIRMDYPSTEKQCYLRLPNKVAWVVQQFTGLKAKNGDIYEGDIIKFKYWVGDFAWQDMDEKETKRQQKMRDKGDYVGIIVPALDGTINLEILVGKRKETHAMFPLLYARNSEIIGNIMENPELI